MSAFGTTAEDVTASTGAVPGTIVAIGPDTAAWVDIQPRLAAGARISPPVDGWVTSAGVPRPAAGKRVDIPSGIMTWAAGRAVFSISALVRVPASAMVWTAALPALRSGGSALIPMDVAAEADVPVVVRAGKRLSLPPNLLAEMGATVRPSTGKREDVPATSFGIFEGMVLFGVGTRVNIDNTVSEFYTLEATGEDATAADGTITGDPEPQTTRVPDVVNWIDLQLRVSSGGSGIIPADPLTETGKRLEIGARRRMLRVWSIAN